MYSTPYNNEYIEKTIRSLSPPDMMDLLTLDAASWNATPLHDLYFVEDPNLDLASKPSQFAKWLIEKDNAVDISKATKGTFQKSLINNKRTIQGMLGLLELTSPFPTSSSFVLKALFFKSMLTSRILWSKNGEMTRLDTYSTMTQHF